MKRLTTHLSVLFLLLFVAVSCQKEQHESVTPLVFKSLTPSSPAFPHGESVQITADVEGTNVTYYWSYAEGSINGSGSTIVYTCDIPGSQKVICTVQDGSGNIEDKHLVLQVQ